MVFIPRNQGFRRIVKQKYPISISCLNENRNNNICYKIQIITSYFSVEIILKLIICKINLIPTTKTTLNKE